MEEFKVDVHEVHYGELVRDVAKSANKRFVFLSCRALFGRKQFGKDLNARRQIRSVLQGCRDRWSRGKELRMHMAGIVPSNVGFYRFVSIRGHGYRFYRCFPIM